MDGPLETVIVFGPFVSAIVALVLLVVRRPQSLPTQAVCVAFIAIGLALVWWWARWTGDSCEDQASLGGCATLDSWFSALLVAWVAILVFAAVLLLYRRRPE